MKIAITCRQMARDIEQVRPLLDRFGLEVSCPPVVQELAGDELVAALSGAVGVIAGDDRFSGDVLEQCDGLRVISRWGVGVDAIDLDAAAEHGIAVTNTPGAFNDDVADVALAYIIMLARDLHRIDRGVRAGLWPKPAGIAVHSAALGIVGLGGIGRELGVKAQALGMTVYGTDPAPTSCELAKDRGIQVVGLEDLLGGTDFLSLHCPLTPDTRHILNRDRFRQMRSGMRLVNTGRGPLVDEAALVEALRDGTLAGAALDVFEHEPLPDSSPLRSFENVIFGSHNASNTVEACARTHVQALGNLVDALGLSPK